MIIMTRLRVRQSGRIIRITTMAAFAMPLLAGHMAHAEKLPTSIEFREPPPAELQRLLGFPPGLGSPPPVRKRPSAVPKKPHEGEPYVIAAPNPAFIATEKALERFIQSPTRENMENINRLVQEQGLDNVMSAIFGRHYYLISNLLKEYGKIKPDGKIPDFLDDLAYTMKLVRDGKGANAITGRHLSLAFVDGTAKLVNKVQLFGKFMNFDAELNIYRELADNFGEDGMKLAKALYTGDANLYDMVKLAKQADVSPEQLAKMISYLANRGLLSNEFKQDYVQRMEKPLVAADHSILQSIAGYGSILGFLAAVAFVLRIRNKKRQDDYNAELDEPGEFINAIEKAANIDEYARISEGYHRIRQRFEKIEGRPFGLSNLNEARLYALHSEWTTKQAEAYERLTGEQISDVSARFKLVFDEFFNRYRLAMTKEECDQIARELEVKIGEIRAENEMAFQQFSYEFRVGLDDAKWKAIKRIVFSVPENGSIINRLLHGSKDGNVIQKTVYHTDQMFLVLLFGFSYSLYRARKTTH